MVPLVPTLSLSTGKRPGAEVLQRMLACNADLPGTAKFTLADDPPLPCLSAEILLGGEETDLGDGASLRYAAALARRRGSSPGSMS